MSKKHFIKLAAALNATKPRSTVAEFGTIRFQWEQMVKAVADVCASTNPRFNRARFLAACGMEDN